MTNIARTWTTIHEFECNSDEIGRENLYYYSSFIEVCAWTTVVLYIHLTYSSQFMYNYNNNSLPQAFNNMFPKNQSFHNYPTRRSNEFHLPLLRTLLAQNTFIYTGPRFWNSLDNVIRNARSLNSFKSKLKSFLFQSYSNSHSSWIWNSTFYSLFFVLKKKI